MRHPVHTIEWIVIPAAYAEFIKPPVAAKINEEENEDQNMKNWKFKHKTRELEYPVLVENPQTLGHFLNDFQRFGINPFLEMNRFSQGFGF